MGIQAPGVQRSELLARTQSPIAGEPVAPEPAEEQTPPVAVPVEARDAAAAARTPPDRSREGQIELPELRRDLVLVLQEPFGVFLTEIGVELFASSTDHLFPVDRAFARFEEGYQFQVGDRVDGPLGTGLHELPAFLPHVAGEGGGVVADGDQLGELFESRLITAILDDLLDIRREIAALALDRPGES